MVLKGRTDNIFKESQRVLKNKGYFIFITPNLGNPLFLLNSMLGEGASRAYYKYLMRADYKPHRTYYRFNTARKIKKVCDSNGFELKKIIYLGPSCFLKYFSFSKTIQQVVAFMDRLVTNKVFCFFKPYMICVAEKNDEKYRPIHISKE